MAIHLNIIFDYGYWILGHWCLLQRFEDVKTWMVVFMWKMGEHVNKDRHFVVLNVWEPWLTSIHVYLQMCGSPGRSAKVIADPISPHIAQHNTGAIRQDSSEAYILVWSAGLPWKCGRFTCRITHKRQPTGHGSGQRWRWLLYTI